MESAASSTVRSGLRLIVPLMLSALLGACVTVAPHTPKLNPAPAKTWFYLLDIEPALPASEVRVEALYVPSKPECPLRQVGTDVPLEPQGLNYRMTVYLDRFDDPLCGWRFNQLWLGLNKESGYATRFSVVPGGGDQTRWCRLNPEHGVCMLREQDILDYKVPGTVHRVRLMQQ
ncbi:hypothetical protein B5T_02446 [Alloalcanivorax dieselolei B5]|uniref:Uncharacterized protein n=1 Tax=Alcanivorax dieselolei (strain DSM 16502 / CGMCC 1.3690 / MCCC 1A00001 / B-5) TaxID=930169 RepID=K0CEJ5_ALCDB|nr:hypothetical protein [Alloalcanivorax dieselolei]AFT70720.1 hypothetical protein B5T_02446 [Alloalcanivorax dieselolei B5]GGJ97283.1 hypothetical protein GCM10007426_27860 [Alloalcanivorax dieselolei]